MFEANTWVKLVALMLAAKVLSRGFGAAIEGLRFFNTLKFFSFLAFVCLGWNAPLEFIWASVVFRLGYLYQRCLVAAPNHPVLELILLLACGFGLEEGSAEASEQLAIFLQVAIASVWFYAGMQKLLSRQFISGLFFYVFLSHRERYHWSQRLFMPRPWIAPLVGPEPGGMAPGPLRAALLLGYATVVMELAMPALALRFAGGVPAVFLMIFMALALGLFAREWSFMLSNCLISLIWMLPFDFEVFLDSLRHPAFIVLGLWLALWPPIHSLLYRILCFSPSRLYGWGMYCYLEPLVTAYDADGQKLKWDTKTARYLPCRALIQGFGMSRIGWLRRYAHSFFQKWGTESPIAAFQFLNLRREGYGIAADVTLVSADQRMELEDRAVYAWNGASDEAALEDWRRKQIDRWQGEQLPSGQNGSPRVSSVE